MGLASAEPARRALRIGCSTRSVTTSLFRALDSGESEYNGTHEGWQPLLTSHMKRPSRITGGASSCHRRVTNPIYALPPNRPELDIHVRIGLAGRQKTVPPTCAM